MSLRYWPLGGGGQQVKPRNIIKKEKTSSTMPTMTGGGKQRKFSPVHRPPPRSPEMCWVCGKKGHFKD